MKGLNINNRLRSPDLVTINVLMSIKYKLKLLVLAIYSITINNQFFFLALKQILINVCSRT